MSFLKRAKESKGKIAVEDNILVVGGGDVAMDVCTTLKLLGAPNVTDVVYEEFFEFRASKKELEGAQQMGVTIIDGYVPTEVEKNTVTFKHRRIPGSVKITADKIILAVGQAADVEGLGINIVKGEADIVGYQLEDKKIWVGGDISHNQEKTVVGSVKNGKELAYYISKFLGVK